ncbi:methyltransferase (TIGR00027 family) [Chitinophaga dinghuensis]|uniref:S-adenosyl-L-methionine-dependent methyltransferase n=1 Tax=Chitinophaga dinghuensis TaxID=1539050 RepID=A0A327W4K2_9BACT|nr:class I SAM-dependent methyltransferase [Chitinophaga dinghuensis]RAJ83290.1 methyltransferase (TIGR00027 family) [Chitinophaga dinghuensis]
MSWMHGGRATLFMAFARAIESTAPATKRIIYDPFAAVFLPSWMQTVTTCCNVGLLRRVTKSVLQLRWPGAFTAAIARTRLIDDMIQNAVNQHGINQIIIVNARLDTRAHRLKTSMPVHFVEVDLKESQLEKQEKLYNILPEQVTFIDYIPVNIHQQSLSEGMIGHLQREHYKTLFLWEGVTSNLKAKEIADFFQYISRYPAGTQLIMTYIHKSALDNPDMFKGFHEASRSLEKGGETWDFGLYPGSWNNIFQNINMEVSYDGGANDYRPTYFGKSGQRMKGYEFFRVLQAALK